MLLRVEREASMAVKSHNIARSVPWSMGRIRSRVLRAVPHVRQLRQLRQALRRVARAVPRGAMRLVRARLMESTVVGVFQASRAMYVA